MWASLGLRIPINNSNFVNFFKKLIFQNTTIPILWIFTKTENDGNQKLLDVFRKNWFCGLIWAWEYRLTTQILLIFSKNSFFKIPKFPIFCIFMKTENDGNQKLLDIFGKNWFCGLLWAWGYRLTTQILLIFSKISFFKIPKFLYCEFSRKPKMMEIKNYSIFLGKIDFVGFSRPEDTD